MERLMHDVLLPALKKIVFDRTPAMRKQLIAVVSGWLTQETAFFKVCIHIYKGNIVPWPYPCFVTQIMQTSEADLLLVLLLGFSDDTAEVREATKIEVDAVGKAWASR